MCQSQEQMFQVEAKCVSQGQISWRQMCEESRSNVSRDNDKCVKSQDQCLGQNDNLLLSNWCRRHTLFVNSLYLAWHCSSVKGLTIISFHGKWSALVLNIITSFSGRLCFILFTSNKHCSLVQSTNTNNKWPQLS